MEAILGIRNAEESLGGRRTAPEPSESLQYSQTHRWWEGHRYSQVSQTWWADSVSGVLERHSELLPKKG